MIFCHFRKHYNQQLAQGIIFTWLQSYGDLRLIFYLSIFWVILSDLIVSRYVSKKKKKKRVSCCNIRLIKIIKSTTIKTHRVCYKQLFAMMEWCFQVWELYHLFLKKKNSGAIVYTIIPNVYTSYKFYSSS